MGDLGINLGLLCSYQPSIAEVCRRIGINRQQFNKYLNGSAMPSRRNLRAICDFFGVSESEITLEAPDFADIVSLRRREAEECPLGPAREAVRTLLATTDSLEKYEGYYFRYFPSYGSPGKFVKSLGCIRRNGTNHYWKNNEILKTDTGMPHRGFGKWHGIFLSFADRLYLVEYDTATTATPISSSIFFPCHRSKLDFLVGVQTGSPLRRGRAPCVSRVVLEYLGREIDIRPHLARCGLLSPGNPELSPQVISMLDGERSRGTFFLEAEEV